MQNVSLNLIENDDRDKGWFVENYHARMEKGQLADASRLLIFNIIGRIDIYFRINTLRSQFAMPSWWLLMLCETGTGRDWDGQAIRRMKCCHLNLPKERMYTTYDGNGNVISPAFDYKGGDDTR